MEYTLGPLDQLVTDTINATGGSYTISKTDAARILHEALQETAKIKALLVQEVFSFSKEKEIEVYIQHYQVALTHLLDRLYLQQQQEKIVQQAAISFYQNLYQYILSLLSFIEERFSKYFDKSEKVPEIYLALARQELQQRLVPIGEMLEFSGEDAVMAAKVNQKLKDFLDPGADNSITYRGIMFYKDLFRELGDIYSWTKGAGTYSGLEQLLIYLNYNDKEFINDMVNRVNAKLQVLDDLNDKIDHLLIYSKALHQLQFKPDIALLHRHPSVKTQLSNWFAEELGYFDRKMGLLSIPSNNDVKESNPIREKVLCQVSVDQLGIFFRAASDLHLISTPSQKILFETITPLLSTSHRSSLSAESMRSKSYSPEKRDIEIVKDILMQLFRQVGKF